MAFSLAVVDIECAIIEQKAVNRSLIKSLNPAMGNETAAGSVRLSSIFEREMAGL